MFVFVIAAGSVTLVFPMDDCHGLGNIGGKIMGQSLKPVFTNGPNMKQNRAIQLDGKPSSLVTIPALIDGSPLFPFKSFTIIVNIYAEKTHHGPILDFGKHGMAIYTDNNKFEITIPKQGAKKVTGKDKFSSKANTLVKDTWSNVAVTFNGDNGDAKIYINGKFDNSLSLGARAVAMSEALRLGPLVMKKSFKGKVSCLQIYDKALTAQEVNDKQTCPICELMIICLYGWGTSNRTVPLVEQIKMGCQ